MRMDIIGGLLKFLVFVMVFGGVFFAVYAIYQLGYKKLAQEAQQLEESSTLKAMRRIVLRRLGSICQRFITPGYHADLTRRITAAGGLDDTQPPEIVALQVLSAVFFTFVGIMVINFLRSDLDIKVGWWVLIFFLALGVYYPVIWLNDQVKKRHWKITRELPYNMDLLTLSVEAGLDFQAAVDTVVKKGKPGPLQQEFSIMLRELRMGKTRHEALRNMSERVQLSALNQFVAALIQADRMGTSLGTVLRIQSDQMRTERAQRAEKLANEAPVKMLFPLIFCIFPTVFIILFGPIVYQLISGEF
jgi:tight adherence protein C